MWRPAIVLATLVATACVTSGKPEFKTPEVVERIGGDSETPEWATGKLAEMDEGADHIYINTIEMSGDARPEACTRAASEHGREAIIRSIQEHLSHSGQTTETSGTADPAVESLIAALAQRGISGVHVTARYWERFQKSDSSGERVLRIRCAAKVAISKALLKRQMDDVINGGSTDARIREAQRAAQQRYFDSIGDADSAKAEPTAH